MLFDNLVKVFCIAPASIYRLGIAGSGVQTATVIYKQAVRCFRSGHLTWLDGGICNCSSDALYDLLSVCVSDRGA